MQARIRNYWLFNLGRMSGYGILFDPDHPSTGQTNALIFLHNGIARKRRMLSALAYPSGW